ASLCLSYWTQTSRPIPVEYRHELGSQVYGCDICQEVCPWNRGVEKRRQGVATEGATPTVSLVDWLERDGVELVADFDRLFVPKNDPRWLRRNALVALGNTGTPDEANVAARYAEADDDVLADAGRWALARISERAG